jgi:APA family basic amino acid/polyamine antiporter
MTQPRLELPRRLGFLDATSIVAGTIIGAGIFLVPSLVAASLNSPAAILAVWVFGGVLSFFGALALAELGAMMPATGGQYVFLREAYGPMVAFLCGWTFFLVSISAAIAWLAVSFARYLGYFVPLPPAAAKAVGVVLIAVIAAVNYRGARPGAGVQKTFAAVKILGIVVLVVSAFGSAPAAAAPPTTQPLTFSAIGVGLIACLMCYDGWSAMSAMVGEIRDPRRNVLRALAAGLFVCIVIYTLTNIAYLRVLTVPEMAASERVGALLAERTLGPAGAALISVLIMVSIIGSANGWLMTQPRIYFAQSRDGLFFRRFGEIHPRFETPAFAIVMQFLWASVLIVTGSFELLISYAMFAIWFFYALTVGAVITLRLKRPDLPRPYRMWGYPVTPALFIAVALWFLINTAIEQPLPSLTALAIILAGIPAYFAWKYRTPASGQQLVATPEAES